ncbi:MAG TPA: class A beta-lactamase [Magnetospirillaceae bacterium]|nr:class A beta-lactamase [Magnetospirillaceae bacterium]
MPPILSRRSLMIGASLVPLAGRAVFAAEGGIQDRLREVESGVGGRLGIAALDMESDRRVDYRSSSLFPMCSTYKLLLAGAVLSKIDHGKESLDREIPLTQADLLDYAPVAKPLLAKGKITIAEACAGAIVDSDNTAANLLLTSIGGPGALTLFARALGDKTTHLDRVEPFLNEATPGDARDTTSPAAMLNDLGVLVLQDALSKTSRDLLADWLVKSRTGMAKLRAGMPDGWKIGDKTGMGERGSTCDIAIAWPPGRKPLLIAAYLTESSAALAERNKALADVARLVVAELVSGS